MNLAVSAPFWLILVFGVVLLAAAAQDVRSLRISNMICLAAVIIGLAAMLFVGLDPRLWQNGAAFASVLGVGTLFFSRGWLGGGDVKLFAAAALWFDLRTAGLVLVPAVFISGGVLAAIVIVAKRLRGHPKPANGSGRKTRLPYGVAIAIGAIMALYIVKDAARPAFNFPPVPRGAPNG